MLIIESPIYHMVQMVLEQGSEFGKLLNHFLELLTILDFGL